MCSGSEHRRPESYLVEITAEVLSQVDAHTGKPLVDVIVDAAGQKGTGRWTAINGLELGVPVTGIAEAVFARALSSATAQRERSRGLGSGQLAAAPTDKVEFVDAINQALYASKVVAYAQGFDQILAGSQEYDRNVKPGYIATIWRGGCIIRATFLDRIREAYAADPQLPACCWRPTSVGPWRTPSTPGGAWCPRRRS